MAEIIKPGCFGSTVAADSLRMTFDIQNEQIVNENKAVDFVFIGDSITCYWQLNLYFDKLGLVINRGIGGDSTEYILKRSDADVFQLKPKNVVYLAGINDLLTTSPDLWWRKQGANKDAVISSIRSNTQEFIKKCTKHNIKGYFGSVLPTDFCMPYNSFGIEDMILEVNKDIKSLCKQYGMVYVDYYSSLCTGNKQHIKDGFTHDGVHPNSKAYSIMADLLKKCIEAKK